MWKPAFNQDTDKPGVGTAIANFTPDNAEDTRPAMSYSRRVDTGSPDDVSAFCREARESLAKTVAVEQDRQNFVDKIFMELTK